MEICRRFLERYRKRDDFSCETTSKHPNHNRPAGKGLESFNDLPFQWLQVLPAMILFPKGLLHAGRNTMA